MLVPRARPSRQLVRDIAVPNQGVSLRTATGTNNRERGRSGIEERDAFFGIRRG